MITCGKPIVCSNGAIVSVVKVRRQFGYQVLCPMRGLFPPQGLSGSEAEARAKGEQAAVGFGGASLL
jgi:hypothetical protein